ncbi:MAG: TolC family protein [Bacteriovoracaceae bacterium]
MFLLTGGNYYTSRDIGGKNPDWDVALMLTFPLFSGGSTGAEMREVTAKKRENELMLSAKRRDAEVEIKSAYNSLVSALNQIKALEAALKFTEQNYKEQRGELSFGEEATNLDVISALNSLQDTKRSLDKMHFQALTSWAKLKAASEEIDL